MPPTTVHYALLPTEQFDTRSLQLHGFLDMLRYDAAQVVEVGHAYVVLRTPHPRGFTLDRWRSFGLYPLGPVRTQLHHEGSAIHQLQLEYAERTTPA